MKDVHLLANYTVTYAKDNNGAAKFGSHIKIEFLLESYLDGGV
ncbi:TasA family protein [Bacillus sp. UNCCL81]|nr:MULTISPECIES: TasA family protein [unclassified Bacillus (in: firmicutes)]